MKQTAIQLLRESIDTELKLGTKMVINWDMYLAVEREQIEDAYYDGQSVNAKSVTRQMIVDNSMSYYNETYKGGEQ